MVPLYHSLGGTRCELQRISADAAHSNNDSFRKRKQKAEIRTYGIIHQMKPDTAVQ